MRCALEDNFLTPTKYEQYPNIITQVPLVKNIQFGLCCLVTVILSLFLKNTALGQCAVYERVYAASESHTSVNGSVTNFNNAVGSNTADYSTLTAGLLGSATQYLQFASTVSSGTSVTIKLSIPPALLGVLSGLKIQPYINTPTSYTAVGSAITNTSLVSLLGGTGDDDVTITPSGNFDGVAVTVTGGISLGQTMQIYDAYYLRPSNTNSACNTPIDAESGNKPMTTLATIGTILGQTFNPEYAIDGSPNTYAEIDAVGTVASQVYHAAIFGSLSQPGDTVKMIVQNSGSGLLDLGVGSGFSIQFYNGNTAVGSPIAGISSSLKLTLFPDASQKYELDVSPPASIGQWDRVEVRVGGVASLGLTQGLKIYDVKRVIENPVINSTTSSTQTVCEGNTTTFTVSNVQPCTTYSWYDAANGGNQLQLDPLNPNYTPPTTLTAGDHQFFVQAARNGCTENTTRTPATLKVNPLPTIVVSGHPKVCLGGASTAVSYTTTNSAQTYSIAWNAAAHGAGFTDVADAPLPTGGSDIVVNVPGTAPAATYNGMLTVKNANGCISSQQPFSIDVDALPSAPVINLTP